MGKDISELDLDSRTPLVQGINDYNHDPQKKH